LSASEDACDSPRGHARPGFRCCRVAVCRRRYRRRRRRWSSAAARP